MKHISTQQLYAFSDQLSKEADLKSWLGGYAGRALIGAGAGAGLGVATAAEGEGLQGGIRGALLGGTLGVGSKLVTKSGRHDVANFARRQRYGVTGGGLKDKTVGSAKKIGLLESKASLADREAFHKGYQNIPGVLRGLATNPGDVLRSGWKRGGTLGKVFTGLGAVDAARSLAMKPEEGGPGRFERALGSGIGSLGYLAAPTGIVPSMLMGGAAGVIGSRAGRLVDRMTGHKRQPAEGAS
jgi:hypothetical protein